MASYFIGVDVGTGSARAGVFDLNGRMVGQASRAIDLYRPKADFVEQSSDNIWQAVCNAVRDAVNQADINPIQVKGLGFDATCSLVVLDKEGKPLTVSPSGRTEQNIIVWMDHRAIAQAERINATKHRVLDFVGGIISPEMQTPKLLWLKQHMPTTWANAGYLFDLPDFLTWRATQDATRSLCSTVCKWTYLGHEQRWDKSYFQQIGLEDVLEHDAAKIGSDVKMMGEPLGHGLTQRAASEMGLIAGTAVSVSIILAYRRRGHCQQRGDLPDRSRSGAAGHGGADDLRRDPGSLLQQPSGDGDAQGRTDRRIRAAPEYRTTDRRGGEWISHYWPAWPGGTSFISACWCCCWRSA